MSIGKIDVEGTEDGAKLIIRDLQSHLEFTVELKHEQLSALFQRIWEEVDRLEVKAAYEQFGIAGKEPAQS